MIKNIIFDLGNVLCDINFDYTIKAFKKLADSQLSLSVEDYINDPVFGGLEKGDFTVSVFYDKLRKLFQTNISNEEINKAWTALIINSDQERIDLVQSLAPKYRVFLLSNTNSIHIDYVTKLFKKSFGVEFRDLFEKTYLSYELKMSKPNEDIYKHVIKDAGIIPKETFFVDDNLANIEMARSLGINSLLFTPNKEKLATLFKDF